MEFEEEEEIKKFKDYLFISVEENTKTVADYIQILRRRKYMVVIPALIILAITIIVASVMPNTYRSEAKISIRKQQIPLHLIESTVISNAEERIAVIKRDFMVYEKLEPIIKEFNVYKVDKFENHELVKKFENDFDTDINTKKVLVKGKKREVALSFTVSFQHKKPKTAMQVTEAIAQQYYKENFRLRTENAKETTKFLHESSEKFKAELNKIEEELEKYKKKHNKSLPELTSANLNTVSRIETELLRFRSEDLTLKEQERALRAKLIITSPVIFSSNGTDNKNKSLPELKAEYKQLLITHKAGHPDAEELKRRISSFVEQSSSSTTKSLDYQNIENDINRIKIERKNIATQKKELNKKLTETEENIAKSYHVERQYQKYLRDLESRQAKYNELRAKAMDAKFSQELEEKGKAETFRILKHAKKSKTPEQANWVNILLIGLVASIVAGLGTGYLFEMMDSNIRGYKSLTAVTGMPPLIVIPYIKNLDDANRTRKNIINFSIMTLIVIVTTTGIIFFIKNFVLTES